MIARMPLAFPLAAAAGFGVLLGLVASGWGPLDRLDTALSERARDYGSAHPDQIEIQRQITDTAQTSVFFGLGLASAVALLLLRRAYADAALIAASFAAVPAAWGICHALLHRPRPVGGFVAISSNGFPSGHASNSATIALVVVLLLWHRVGPAGKVAVVAVTAAFALAIGATRVTLLAHWPTDVIGAWLLVFAIVPLLARATGRLSSGSREPRSPA
ncbi:MAG: phosphatase PAP2 family protein [Micromonosporaceae bacterium]|nr:phosphatase PAP2 family protein [Micromonosporaceae bacterium]